MKTQSQRIARNEIDDASEALRRIVWRALDGGDQALPSAVMDRLRIAREALHEAHRILAD